MVLCSCRLPTTDTDDWIETIKDRVTPSDSSRSSVGSPDTLLDMIDKNLSSGAYELNYDFSAVDRVSSALEVCAYFHCVKI